VEIRVYENFSKRVNSTLRPNNNAGTVKNVQLKEDCTIENPVFILSGNNFNINYIKAFDKYYFVDKITSLDNSRCEYSCVEDVLATAKTAIGNTTALILRSSSSYDTYIRDDMVSLKASRVSTQRNAFQMPFDTTGCFVVSVVKTII